MKKTGRRVAWIAAAVPAALAPFWNPAPAPVAKPDVPGAFGLLYQLIHRSFASVSDNRLALCAMLLLTLFLCRRYLFRKPEHTGVGEYLLAAGLGLLMVLFGAVRTEGTVRALWQNAFQCVKSLLAFAGYAVLELLLLRALNEGLERLRRPVREPEKAISRKGVLLTLSLCWLPHIIIRYPGVLMWDSYMQIKQFTGEAVRTASHPPFGTVLYGLLYQAGKVIGSHNAAYFLFMLAGCALYIWILSETVLEMQRAGVRRCVWLGVLGFFAFCPIFPGWATVIAKDTGYQIAYLGLMLATTVWIRSPERIKEKRWFWLFGFSALCLMLQRNNGIAAVAVLGVGLLLGMLRRNRLYGTGRMVIAVAGCILLAYGIRFGIMKGMNIQGGFVGDVFALPFQQTARTARLHGEEIPDSEREILNRVMDYDHAGTLYEEWYSDAVKDTYRASATGRDRLEYLRVWLGQLVRYPVEYLDAALHMNGVMFDLQSNRAMYISFSDNALYDTVYPYAFNDMKMYEREPLVPLNSLQLALTDWYYGFEKLPVVGLLAQMGFHTQLTLMLLYLTVARGKRKALLAQLPSLVTLVMLFFSPVVYLRYALPMMASFPYVLILWEKRETGDGRKIAS